MHNDKQTISTVKKYMYIIYITIYKKKSRETSLIALKIVRSTVINSF